MIALSQRFVSLPIEQVYSKLKDALLKGNCKVTEEKAPTYISVKQGSLNGIMPKSAKKTVKFNLTQEGTGTRITGSTQIASDWANLTLYGNIVAAVLAAVFLWVAQDMQNYVEAAKVGYWSWLASSFQQTSNVMVMVDVTRALAVFLVAAIMVEVGVVYYVYPRKDAFAQATLQQIQELPHESSVKSR